MLQRALTTMVCFCILGWLALSASNGGVIVWQEGPRPIPGLSRPGLMCSYFSGTGLFERGYLYSPADSLGYSRCPVWARQPV
ncbi:MAG: hypothetical protein NW205_00620 [Hyphomicrobiaceae bacterium]|nr:hypothetical protein [Hyphomicrobiaceae bacterium]